MSIVGTVALLDVIGRIDKNMIINVGIGHAGNDASHVQQPREEPGQKEAQEEANGDGMAFQKL